jgi:hypothetical protein
VINQGQTTIYADASGASELLGFGHVVDMQINLVGVSVTATDLILHH